MAADNVMEMDCSSMVQFGCMAHFDVTDFSLISVFESTFNVSIH